MMSRMRDRRTGPTGPHEANCLELPGSGQPPDSSGSSGPLEDGGGGYSFLVGDKARQAKNGAIQVDVGVKQHGGA
jgi:hypothetical protein